MLADHSSEEECSEIISCEILITDPGEVGDERYYGALGQRARGRAEVIPNLQARWPDILEVDDTTRPNALYFLGPQLPGTPIPNGASYRAQRRWVILDHLLTSPALQDALHQTSLIATEP